VESPEDDRARHEALEPRILYSASPIEEPQVTEQPIVADYAAPVVWGGRGARGPATVAQDQIPAVHVESQSLDSTQIAAVLSKLASLPARDVSQIGGAEAGSQFRIQGMVNWSQLGLNQESGSFPITVQGSEDTDDVLSLDLSNRGTSLDLFFDGGAGGFDTLRINCEKTGR